MKAPQHTPESRAHAAAEYRDTHLAICRYRRQGIVCSTCSDVVERAQRMARLVPRPAIREVRGRFEDLFPKCKTPGCTDLSEAADGYCAGCGYEREYTARMASKRAAVAAGRI